MLRLRSSDCGSGVNTIPEAYGKDDCVDKTFIAGSAHRWPGVRVRRSSVKYQRGEITQFFPGSDSGLIRPSGGGPEVRFKVSRVRPPFDRNVLTAGQQVLYSTKTKNS